MTTRPWWLSLLAVPLVLGGCAAAEGATQPASSPSPVASAAADAAAADEAPPATATMVCGAEFRGDVAQVLSLASPAPTEATWVDPLYTCTHQLPMGPLVLSVEVSPTPAAAADRFAARQVELGDATPAPGLGERAVATPAGTVVVIKDDMTLTVDATALPAVFGQNGQQRTDFAYEIASVVLGCWTGHE